MDAILNYKSEDAEDYYTLLGCDELSSVSQEITRCFFHHRSLSSGLGLLVELPKNLDF